MITKKFNAKTAILEVNFIGDIDIEQLLELQKELKNDFSLPRELNIFYNTTKAKGIPKGIDLPLLIEGTKDLLKYYNFIKSTFFANSSKINALSTVYKQRLADQKNYQFDIFCTKDAAIKSFAV